MKRLALLLSLTLFLTGCGFYDILGIDTHDYWAEEPILSSEESIDAKSELFDIVSMMVQNTPYLSEFDSPAEAASLYRDGILCFVLLRNFSKYSGNNDLIAKTREQYSTYEITTVIPAVDFESTVYRYFGGTTSVRNASTKLFTYLDKVDAYVSVGIGVDNSADVEIEDLYETENTFVAEFSCKIGGVSSPKYKALLMKREDGTLYMKALMEVK